MPRVAPSAPRRSAAVTLTLIGLLLPTPCLAHGERVPVQEEALDYHAKWAVIIDIDEYPGGASGLEPLLFAVNDAREVHELLRDEFGFGRDEARFDEGRILFLADERATRPARR